MSRKFKKLPRVRPDAAIVYLRVSSGQQVDNFSLDTQEAMCRERADKNGWSVLKVFREKGESAKTSERTEFKEMRDYVIKHHDKIGYVIFGRIDRMNRDIIDYYIFKGLLRDYGIMSVSIGENITEGAEGLIIEAVSASVAQVENMAKSKRTADGLRARAAAGYWSGIAPIGFLNTEDRAARNNLVVDPQKSICVRQLFEDFATQTFSYKDLADKYGERLMSKNKVRMYPQRIEQLLQNPVYIGRIEKPEWNISVQARFPAIVPDELFYKVHNLINGHPASRKLPRRRINDDFPLRGILCSHCGRNITGGWSTGKMGKKYPYYNCTNRKCPMRMEYKSIKKANLENDFSAFLEENAPTDDFFVELREAAKLSYEAEILETTKANKEAENRIAKLKAEKVSIVDLIVQEPDLREELKMQLMKKDNEIREIESTAKGLQVEISDVGNAVDFAADVIQNFHKEWKNMTAKQLGVLTKLLFPKNLTYNYPNIQTPELCIVYTLYRRFQSENERMVPRAGVEPARPYEHDILSVTCIAISPPGQ